MNENVCESLDAFLDSELDATELEVFQEHLAHCTRCPNSVEQQVGMDNALRTYAETILPRHPVPHVTLPEPPRTNFRRYMLTIAEISAVVMIGSAIWFALGRTAAQQEIAQVKAEQVAAPPSEKSTTEVVAPPSLDQKEFVEASTKLDSIQKKRFQLIKKRSENFEVLRSKQITLSQIEQLENNARDPVVALTVVKKLLGLPAESSIEKRIAGEPDREISNGEAHKLFVPLMIQRNRLAQMYDDNDPIVLQLDAELKAMRKELIETVREQGEVRNLKFDDKMIPLIVERNKYAAQFGDRHPSVRAIDHEIETMKVELKRQIRENTVAAKNLETLSMKAGKDRFDVKSEACLEIENSIAALKMERSKLEANFGRSHPAVKRIDDEVQARESQLKRQIQAEAPGKLTAIIKSFKREIVMVKNELAEAESEIERLKDVLLGEAERVRKLRHQD